MQYLLSKWKPAHIVIFLTCLVLLLGWVQKIPCKSGHWSNSTPYKYACYTDLVALFHAEGLSEGKIPYAEHKVEYPVLIGVFMGVTGLPIHYIGEQLGQDFNQTQAFYNVNALVLILFAVGVAYLLLLMRKSRPWDVLLFALAPMMIFSTVVNWDMLAILPAIAGMYAWSKNKPILAGFLLGLGIAAKFYPLLLIGPLFILAIRSRKIKEASHTILTAIITWVIINLPFALYFHEAWFEFFRLNSARAVDWGTSWYIFRHFNFFPSITENIPVLNISYVLLFGACCIGIALLILFAKKKPRLAQVSFLIVALFLITGKVWSQQFVLWLIPLAVLARPKPGAFIAWQIAEVFYFFVFYKELLNALGYNVMPEWVFILASAARLITLLVLCGFVIYEIIYPKEDVLRTKELEDPDGGVLNKTSIK